MTKIVLLTLLLVNALGLMICDDTTDQNGMNPAANAAVNANMLMSNANYLVDANGNVVLDANGNPMTVNGNTAMGANGNFGISNSTQPNTVYPPTGVNPGNSSAGNSAGTSRSMGGNTAGPDAGNLAPIGTPHR